MHEQLKLDNQLCFRFYTVSRLITQAYYPLLKGLDLTYPQYLVMMVLWEQDRQPVNDIAKRLMLNTNTMTPLLKRLETEGFVLREKGEKDARQVIVSLTKKGKQMEQKAACVPTEMAKTFTCNDLLCTPEEVKDIAGLLDTMIAALRNQEEATE